MSEWTPATRLGWLFARVRGCTSRCWRWEAQIKGVEFLGSSEFIGRPLMSVAPGARVILGDGFRCYSSLRANPLGCFQPCVLRAMTPGARLILGPNVGLSGTVLCAGGLIEIGEGTIFGSGAIVFDNDFHVPAGEWGWTQDPQVSGTTAKPVHIGRGVFIGARAMILKGVTIGDRAIIGAGAVVSRDVPAAHRVVGNPARVLPPKESEVRA